MAKPISDLVLRQSLYIAKPYGGNLTLRQLYYRGVHLGFWPSATTSYTRLGNVLSEARLEGRFPLDWIKDRGRELVLGRAHRSTIFKHDELFASLRATLNGLGSQISRDEWYNQNMVPVVLFEKDALSGVFGDVCEHYGVSYGALKGYASVSFMWSLVQEMFEIAFSHRKTPPKRIVLFLLSDCDPDGFGICRSVTTTFKKLLALGRDGKAPVGSAKAWASFPKVLVKRLALTPDQAMQRGLTPFDAKKDSSQYKKYVEDHQTRSAWELDALEPNELREMIATNIESVFDAVQHRKDRYEAAIERLKVYARLKDELVSYLETPDFNVEERTIGSTRLRGVLDRPLVSMKPSDVENLGIADAVYLPILQDRYAYLMRPHKKLISHVIHDYSEAERERGWLETNENDDQETDQQKVEDRKKVESWLSSLSSFRRVEERLERLGDAVDQALSSTNADQPSDNEDGVFDRIRRQIDEAATANGWRKLTQEEWAQYGFYGGSDEAFRKMQEKKKNQSEEDDSQERD